MTNKWGSSARSGFLPADGFEGVLIGMRSGVPIPVGFVAFMYAQIPIGECISSPSYGLNNGTYAEKATLFYKKDD